MKPNEQIRGERRKYVRLRTDVEIKYTVIGRPGTISGFSKNVGAGGICLIIFEPLAAQTPLQMEIKIPDLKEPIQALARVVWQNKCVTPDKQPKECYDMGVEFIGISDFDRFNINRYVLEHIEA